MTGAPTSLATLESLPSDDQQGLLDEQSAEARIMKEKDEAARAASSVGDLKNNFANRMNDLVSNRAEQIKKRNALQELYERAGGEGASMDDGISVEQLQSQTKKHVDEMKRAAEEKEGIHLMNDDPSRLGQNVVGGGDASMELNSNMYAELDGSGRGVHQVDHTFHHESAHGEQIAAPIILLEGHAEIRANEAVGMSMTEHRAGQPSELYGEGQNLAVSIIQRIGRSHFEQAMTQDFSILEEELNDAGQDQGSDNLLETIEEQDDFETTMLDSPNEDDGFDEEADPLPESDPAYADA